ncbi:MAG: amidohydrolase family protein [Acidobacteria bacterium]|nr:amidohydrolase family protein [Acidobacteriota bacterium]
MTHVTYLALLSAAFIPALGAAQSTPSVVISHVSIIDVAGGRMEPDITVVIEGDRIVTVDKSASIRVPRGAQVVDGKGRFLIPGLWDMHVHLSYARDSALPSLIANGVTTVRDMGSSLPEVDEWRTQIAAGTRVGPRILRAGPMLNGREFNRYQLAVSGDAVARAAVRTLHKVGVDFIKVHRATSREAYFAIADEARRLSLPFAGHVPTTVTPVEASDAAQASLEHTETLFEGTFATAAKGKNLTQAIAQWRDAEAGGLIAKLATNGTSFTPTLVAFRGALDALQPAGADPRDKYVAASVRRETEEVVLKPLRQAPPETIAQRRRLFQEFPSIVRMMNQARINLLAGTDLASSLIYPGFSLHDELGLLVEAGLTPLEALRTATSNPATLFARADAGRIGAGQKADLVLLDANPLDDIRNTQHIRAVILNGRVIDRTGLDLLLAQAATLAKAR